MLPLVLSSKILFPDKSFKNFEIKDHTSVHYLQVWVLDSSSSSKWGCKCVLGDVILFLLPQHFWVLEFNITQKIAIKSIEPKVQFSLSSLAYSFYSNGLCLPSLITSCNYKVCCKNIFSNQLNSIWARGEKRDK
jgi:hypothetical protein